MQSDPLRRYIGRVPPKMPLPCCYVAATCSGNEGNSRATACSSPPRKHRHREHTLGQTSYPRARQPNPRSALSSGSGNRASPTTKTRVPKIGTKLEHVVEDCKRKQVLPEFTQRRRAESAWRGNHSAQTRVVNSQHVPENSWRGGECYSAFRFFDSSEARPPLVRGGEPLDDRTRRGADNGAVEIEDLHFGHSVPRLAGGSGLSRHHAQWRLTSSDVLEFLDASHDEGDGR